MSSRTPSFKPDQSRSSSDAYVCVSSSASSMSAQSEVVLPIGPATSSDGARGCVPERLINPYDGRKPTIPHQLAGIRTEPPVSEPVPARHMPAAIATAVPPDDPPPERVVSSGFRRSPNQGLRPDGSVANSGKLAFPTTTAPAERKAPATAESSLGVRSANKPEPNVVRMSNVSKRSLCAIGMPCKGPRSFPLRSSRSRSEAVSSASSALTVMNALSSPLRASICARHDLVRSTDVREPSRSCADASAIVGVRTARAFVWRLGKLFFSELRGALRERRVGDVAPLDLQSGAIRKRHSEILLILLEIGFAYDRGGCKRFLLNHRVHSPLDHVRICLREPLHGNRSELVGMRAAVTVRFRESVQELLHRLRVLLDRVRCNVERAEQERA